MLTRILSGANCTRLGECENHLTNSYYCTNCLFKSIACELGVFGANLNFWRANIEILQGEFTFSKSEFQFLVA